MREEETTIAQEGGLDLILKGMLSTQTIAAYREFFHENPIARLYRQRKRYMLILYSERRDGTMGRTLFSDRFVRFCLLGLLVVLALLSFSLVRALRDGSESRQLYESREAQINQLREENDALLLENISLENKNAVLTQTAQSRIDEVRQELEKDEEAHLPKGLPVDGKAGIEEKADEQGRPIVDFSAEAGAKVVAAGSGSISAVEIDPVYGYVVVIDHGNGYQSIYRNAGVTERKPGDEVKKGDALITVYQDNQVLGYQVKQNGSYLNPVSLMEISG